MYQNEVAWLKNRRSIRRYQQTPVGGELLEEILAAATWAPSAHNRQPWRFAIISKSIVKKRLALAMGDKLRKDLAADDVASKIIEEDADRSYKRITEAPTLVLVCITMQDMDIYPDAKRNSKEWLMAVQSTAMAGQNILLAAHAFGLGACWMCAPLFCPEIVTDALRLPSDWQPQGMITIGYPAETRQKTRRPLSHVMRYLD
jgi:F420 biosynthesis protein FbiB-like protein